jgi:hypothetical protein
MPAVIAADLDPLAVGLELFVEKVERDTGVGARVSGGSRRETQDGCEKNRGESDGFHGGPEGWLGWMQYVRLAPGQFHSIKHAGQLPQERFPDAIAVRASDFA